MARTTRNGKNKSHEKKRNMAKFVAKCSPLENATRNVLKIVFNKLSRQDMITAIETCKQLNKVDLNCFDSFEGVSLTNDDLKQMTWLTHLDLSENCIVTNDGLEYLVNLETLALGSNANITTDGLRPLKNLERLDLTMNTMIDEDKLDFLPELSCTRASYNPSYDPCY